MPAPLARASTTAAALTVLAAGCIGGSAGGGSVTVTTAAGADEAVVEIEAVDIGFSPEEVRVPSGRIRVDYAEGGQFRHTLVIEGVEGFALAVDRGRPADHATIDLDPGTYTYFCDVPGHREQGMEGTLVAG